MMNVVLREWRKENLELLVKLANNKNIADNMRDIFPHPYTLKDAETWLTLTENRKPVTKFAIEAEGALAEGCGMRLFEDVYSRSAEIGYWVAEPFWGKNIATEAVR